jgi:type I restriction enzyme S subunit
MKKGWIVKELGEVCEFEGGSQPPKSVFSKTKKENYIRLIQIRDYKSDNNIVYIPINKAKRFCSERDIMIGRYGPPVFQILEGLKGAYNVALMRAIPDVKILDRDYLFLFLKYSKIQDYIIKLSERAAGQSGVNKEALYSYPIPIPPLLEQKRVVSILDKAFAAIGKAKNNTDKNLQNAKELFESYLQILFAEKGEDWDEKRMIDICTLTNGRAYKQQELLSRGKYTVLRVGNFFTSKDWYYSDLELPEDKYCGNGDLLYAWSASFGPRIWEGEKVIYHYHIWKVTPNTELVSKEFLFLLLEWDKEQIKKAHGTGTTMMHVGKASMEQRVLPLPKIEEQNSIVNKVSAILVETKKLETIYQQKLNDLEELKKSIFQKAFSGQLSESGLAGLKDEQDVLIG